MEFNASQRVLFIGIDLEAEILREHGHSKGNRELRTDLLPEENSFGRESLDERHGLLKMNVVVGRSVDQIEVFIPETVRPLAKVSFLVSFIIVRYVRQSHVSLGVGRI